MNVANVTIAIPAFNGARFLGAAIESALAQTYPRIDVIVCDDCSQDDTVAVAERYAPRVTIHRNDRNLGNGGNWNRCLSLARDADYVIVAHQDDVYSPDLVERCVALLEREPSVGFVLVRGEEMDAECRTIRRSWDRADDALADEQVIPGIVWYERLMRGPLPLMGPVGGVARTTLFERSGPVDESVGFGNDHELYFRMAVASDVGFLAGPVYRWRRHEGQTTARYTKGDRYAATIQIRLNAYRSAERSGKFDAAALARLRHSLAGECCRAARRYALGDAGSAGRNLRLAWSLRPASALTPDFLTASLRWAWTRTFGPTAGGRERYMRTDV